MMNRSAITVSFCLALILGFAADLGSAQQVSGFKAEYLDDYATTNKQLVQLAQAMPADKYSWRPGEGVRSVSEVYVHIAAANYLLLSFTGVTPPVRYFPAASGSGSQSGRAVLARAQQLEKTITQKDDVVQMLNDSLDEVREQFSKLTPADLDKPADFFGQKTAVRRIYLRIFAHVNEHMGQSIAYARVNGIVPPWSRPQSSTK